MMISRRARFGLIAAQLGSVAMIFGGIGDQLIRDLLPAHLQLLEANAGAVSPRVAAVVLALLHTVGYALIAAGIATLALIRQLKSSGDPKFALQAAAVAMLSEGANAFHMHQLGLGLYIVPLSIVILIVTGLIISAVPAWALTRDPASGQ